MKNTTLFGLVVWFLNFSNILSCGVIMLEGCPYASILSCEIVLR
jgi:hypothetical protein